MKKKIIIIIGLSLICLISLFLIFSRISVIPELAKSIQFYADRVDGVSQNDIYNFQYLNAIFNFTNNIISTCINIVIIVSTLLSIIFICINKFAENKRIIVYLIIVFLSLTFAVNIINFLNDVNYITIFYDNFDYSFILYYCIDLFYAIINLILIGFCVFYLLTTKNKNLVEMKKKNKILNLQKKLEKLQVEIQNK